MPRKATLVNVSQPDDRSDEAIKGKMLTVNVESYPGRIAARAFAYAVAAEGDRELAEAILDKVGREG